MPRRNGKHTVRMFSLSFETYVLHSVLLHEASYHICSTTDILDLRFHLQLFDSSKLAIEAPEHKLFPYPAAST